MPNNSIRIKEYPKIRERYGIEAYLRYKHIVNMKIKYKLYLYNSIKQN